MNEVTAPSPSIPSWLEKGQIDSWINCSNTPAYVILSYVVLYLRISSKAQHSMSGSEIHQTPCGRCLGFAEFPRSGVRNRHFFWNYEAMCRWRRRETWAWAKREDHGGFEVDLRAWINWSWHQSILGNRLATAASNEQQQRDYEGTSFLWGDSAGEVEVSSRQTSEIETFIFRDLFVAIEKWRWGSR